MGLHYYFMNDETLYVWVVGPIVWLTFSAITFLAFALNIVLGFITLWFLLLCGFGFHLSRQPPRFPSP